MLSSMLQIRKHRLSQESYRDFVSDHPVPESRRNNAALSSTQVGFSDDRESSGSAYWIMSLIEIRLGQYARIIGQLKMIS